MAAEAPQLFVFDNDEHEPVRVGIGVDDRELWLFATRLHFNEDVLELHKIRVVDFFEEFSGFVATHLSHRKKKYPREYARFDADTDVGLQGGDGAGLDELIVYNKGSPVRLTETNVYWSATNQLITPGVIADLVSVFAQSVADFRESSNYEVISFDSSNPSSATLRNKEHNYVITIRPALLEMGNKYLMFNKDGEITANSDNLVNTIIKRRSENYQGLREVIRVLKFMAHRNAKRLKLSPCVFDALAIKAVEKIGRQWANSEFIHILKMCLQVLKDGLEQAVQTSAQVGEYLHHLTVGTEDHKNVCDFVNTWISLDAQQLLICLNSLWKDVALDAPAAHHLPHVVFHEAQGAKAAVPAPQPLYHAPLIRVAIACARAAEREAVIRVFKKKGVEFVDESTTLSLHHYNRGTMCCNHVKKVELVVFTAEVMGSQNMDLVQHMLHVLQPKFIFMTGMCAGRRGEVELGDVAVAERAFDINEGKATDSGLLRSLTTFAIDHNLRSYICDINKYLDEGDIIKMFDLHRPLSKRYKQEAIYRVLYDSFKADSRLSPGQIIEGVQKYKVDLHSDWANYYPNLVNESSEPSDKTLQLYGGYIVLADKKLAEVKRKVDLLLRPYPQDERESKGFLGPFAVDQSAVRSNINDWNALSKDCANRKLIALDMEAVAVYSSVLSHNQNYGAGVKALVVKSITDFGDTDKDDSFQKYGAELSAAWVYVFIEKYAGMAFCKES